VVRINSQSGKGGVAYVLSTRLGLHPPRELQVEFAQVVQARADAEGGEIDPDRICALFQREYVAQPLMKVPLFDTMVPAHLHVDGAAFAVGAARADEVEQIRHALLRWNVDVRAVHRTGTGLAGSTGMAVYAELRLDDRTYWGAAMADDLAAAVSGAMRSAAARVPRTAEVRRPGAEFRLVREAG
jgi:2-isopropylmalate synthase